MNFYFVDGQFNKDFAVLKNLTELNFADFSKKSLVPTKVCLPMYLLKI